MLHSLPLVPVRPRGALVDVFSLPPLSEDDDDMAAAEGASDMFTTHIKLAAKPGMYSNFLNVMVLTLYILSTYTVGC